MRKTFLPLLVVFVLLLTACNDASPMVQPPIETNKQTQPESIPIASEPSASTPVPNSTAASSSNDDEASSETQLAQLQEISVTESASEAPTEGPIVPTAEPSTSGQSEVPQLPAEKPKADEPKNDPPKTSPTPAAPSESPTLVSAQAPDPSTPEPTEQPEKPSRNYDMNDPNVKAYPIYATAKSAAEFKAGSTEFGNWRSAAETIAIQKNDDPDYMIDGMTFYDWRMKPIQEWVDTYVSANELSYRNKGDYEKTAIIKHIVESGRFEEFIGLWKPGFQHHSRDCAVRSDAVIFLMIAMDFEMFDNVSGLHGSTAHAWNAYWDSSVGAARFLDANLDNNVWNLYVDELDEKSFTLD